MPADEKNYESVVAPTLLTHDQAGTQILRDCAYSTANLPADLTQAKHVAVIKPSPLRPAVPGGFSIDDFTVDETAGKVTCPAGHTRPITRTRAVVFGALCAGCPIRPRCTTSKNGSTIHLNQPH